MEAVKIVAAAVAFAIVYGIAHDQITARVCLQYFTVFHPPIFPTQSPTLLAIGWGVIATWWGGAFIGVILAFAARAGNRPKLTVTTLVRPMIVVGIGMACCAVLFGLLGYRFGTITPAYAMLLPGDMDRRFLADWWAHSASYLSGFLGGLLLCGYVYIQRGRLAAARGLA